ncbi:uncharacterized protein LOC111270276 isoform X2 [Varroa jacobsoni]|uniref:Uncharacterized protein n=1 Tax=Varroa destructor TaxID=109461 RepID=A0A7M7MFK6_VARDE|nr:uncharacterized protein LOC111255367 [Varroa destructor]XP_022706153.1 uncharacterized protein LOC111270276 isoform X1 [Varroa jacobsoni]XP_022706154.1 uncharacterized protein LOC111270276 isoform X2 [Varroa jacobsoni]
MKMQNFVAVVVLSLIVSATFLSGYSQLVGGPRHGFKGHPYYEQEKLGMRMAGRRVVKPVGPLGYAELQAVLLAMAVVLMVSSCLAFAFGLLHEHEMQEHPGNGDPANMLFAEQAKDPIEEPSGDRNNDAEFDGDNGIRERRGYIVR